MVDQPDSVWTPADHGKFTKALEKCLKHYQWLAKNCFMNGIFRYSLVQKFHLTAHMPTLSQWMNPRMSLCLQQNRIFCRVFWLRTLYLPASTCLKDLVLWGRILSGCHEAPGIQLCVQHPRGETTPEHAGQIQISLGSGLEKAHSIG